MRKSYKKKYTKKRRGGKTQKLWKMKGCSGVCKKCGPNCKCGPRCSCKHKCPGNCYKNKMMYGGSPDAPLAYTGKPLPHQQYPPQLAYSAQKGGMIPAVVPALFDTRWSSPINTWPGVSGPHDGSFLKFNTYDKQPEMNPIGERYNETVPPPSIFGGGRRSRLRRTKKKSHRGGGSGIFAQMGSDMTNAYRGWSGLPANPSPMPWKDQVFNNRSGLEDNLNYLRVG